MMNGGQNGIQRQEAAQQVENAGLGDDGRALRSAGVVGNPPERSGNPPVPGWARPPGEPLIDPVVLAELHALDQGTEDGFLEAIVGDFQEAMREQLEIARHALRAGDGAALAAVAHRMRGGCGVLGARHLARICQGLESAGREGRLLEGPPLLAALEGEYRQVQRAMDVEVASSAQGRCPGLTSAVLGALGARSTEQAGVLGATGR